MDIYENINFHGGKLFDTSLSVEMYSYSQLRELKDANKLNVGNLYILQDFRTTYNHNDGSTYLGDVDCTVEDHRGIPIVSDEYQILLCAITSNEFDPNVIILSQPESEKPYLRRMAEWQVRYDFDLDLKGRITYMYDPKYNNTFDFDIFNIRNNWRAYNVAMFLDSANYAVLDNKFDESDAIYLWTIGDFGGCVDSEYSVYDIAPNLTKTGVRNVTIRNSSWIFLKVQATTPIDSSYDYYKSMLHDVLIENSSVVCSGYETFYTTIQNASYLILRDWANYCKFQDVMCVLSAGHSRGLKIGVVEEGMPHQNTSSYLTFVTSSTAYPHSEIRYGEQSVFVSKSSGIMNIFQEMNSVWNYLFRTAVVSRNTANAVAAAVKLDQCDNVLIDIPASTIPYHIKSDNLMNVQIDSFPEDILQLNTQNVEMNNIDGADVYVNYVNTKNDSVRLTESYKAVSGPTVIFFDECKMQNFRTHIVAFMPLGADLVAWGYEIEGKKYPNSTKEYLFACIFHNIGSNTKDFADKELMFYVECEDQTYYTKPYKINSDGSLTLVS